MVVGRAIAGCLDETYTIDPYIESGTGTRVHIDIRTGDRTTRRKVPGVLLPGSITGSRSASVDVSPAHVVTTVAKRTNTTATLSPEGQLVLGTCSNATSE